MKSERRHELQHNTLADWLIKSTETIKPYQNHILAVVTLLVVGILAYAWWSRYSADQTTRAWNDFNLALESGDPAVLARVVESYPNTSVSDVAALISADLHFAKGCEQLFVSKAIGLQELGKAVEAYRKILKQGKTPFVLESATLGLARATEALGDPKSLQQAAEYYEEVVSKWPKGACAALASQRLENLKQPETKRLYAYLVSPSFDPRPAYSGDANLPEKLPDLDMSNLPSDAPSGSLDSSFDKMLEGKDKATDKPAPEKNVPDKSDK